MYCCIPVFRCKILGISRREERCDHYVKAAMWTFLWFSCWLIWITTNIWILCSAVVQKAAVTRKAWKVGLVDVVDDWNADRYDNKLLVDIFTQKLWGCSWHFVVIVSNEVRSCQSIRHHKSSILLHKNFTDMQTMIDETATLKAAQGRSVLVFACAFMCGSRNRMVFSLFSTPLCLREMFGPLRTSG